MIKLSDRQPPVPISNTEHNPETIKLLTHPAPSPAARSPGVRWLSALRRIDRPSSVNRLAAAAAATPSGEISNEQQQPAVSSVVSRERCTAVQTAAVAAHPSPVQSEFAWQTRSPQL